MYVTETTTCSLEIIFLVINSTQLREEEEKTEMHGLWVSSQIRVLNPLYLLKLDFQYTSIY